MRRAALHFLFLLFRLFRRHLFGDVHRHECNIFGVNIYRPWVDHWPLTHFTVAHLYRRFIDCMLSPPKYVR